MSNTRYRRGKVYAADMAVYSRQMSADNSQEISRLQRNLIRALQEDVTPGSGGAHPVLCPGAEHAGDRGAAGGTMDLHANQIQGFFDIPVDNLLGSPIFVDYFTKKFADNHDETMVVSPDVGGGPRPGLRPEAGYASGHCG